MNFYSLEGPLSGIEVGVAGVLIDIQEARRAAGAIIYTEKRAGFNSGNETNGGLNLLRGVLGTLNHFSH